MNKKMVVSLMAMIFALSVVSFAADTIDTQTAVKEQDQIRLQNKEQKKAQIKAMVQEKKGTQKLKKEAVKNAVQQKQQIKTQAREQLKDGSCTGDGTKSQKRNMFGFKVGRGSGTSGSGRGK